MIHISSSLVLALILLSRHGDNLRGEPMQPTLTCHWEQLPHLPEPIGVAGPFAGVSNNALIVAGGANFPDGPPWEGHAKKFHDSIWVLEKPDGHWITAAQTLPRPLAYGVSVSTPEGLVCIGGADAERHYAEVFRLLWKEGRIHVEHLPPLLKPVAFSCAALSGRAIYVAGGIESPNATQALSAFWRLDLSQGKDKMKWEILEPWPGPERHLAVAAVQGRNFFVLSGVCLEKGPDGAPKRIKPYLKDCYRYSPASGKWMKAASLPHPVAAAPSPAPAAGQSRFLVLGGDDGSKLGFLPLAQHPGFAEEILEYDTEKDSWKAIGEMPAPRVTTPVAAWNGRFVIPSGEARPGVRSCEIWALKLTESK